LSSRRWRPGRGAAEGSGGGLNKDLPRISDTRTLCEKMEDALRSGSTSEASWGGGKAKAMATGLKGQDVVDGRKASINQKGGEADRGKAAPNVSPVEARHLEFNFWRRQGVSEFLVEASLGHSSQGLHIHTVEVKSLQQ
jgi:hypothetical protein